MVLAIAFHSLSVRHSETANLDEVILPKIEDAIELLRSRLEMTLLTCGEAKRSLIGYLLFSGDPLFLKYKHHCRGYQGDEGFQRLVVSSNELEGNGKVYEGHKVGGYWPGDMYLMFADCLIELIGKFEALREIRINFQPGAMPSSDPLEAPLLAGSD
ncbi:hypothetical protein D3C77_311460 [compost metagenome]